VISCGNSRSRMDSWSCEVSRTVGTSRRDFLRAALGMSAGSALLSFAPLRAMAAPRGRKVIVVTFGGGARDEETFAPEGQQNIPHLMNELIPRSTFFTQVVNHGILGHYVATASLVTGVYETFDNFAAVSPDNPTVFEYFRKGLDRPAVDAWVVAPSNGFNGIGASNSAQFGPDLGAGVILPKHLLAAALSSSDVQLNGNTFELQKLEKLLNLSVSDFTAHARSLSSPDELSVYIVHQLMKQLAPSLIWVTLHDMDIAHSGTYSLYLEGIQRTDRLCAEIWNTVQSEPEYVGKTTMFILPDFGRDSDTDPGGNGFQHHRTGDPSSRTTWMMALGPNVRENIFVNRPVQSIDLVPTLGAMFGFSPTMARGSSLVEVL
jgi:hypothetical protein